MEDRRFLNTGLTVVPAVESTEEGCAGRRKKELTSLRPKIHSQAQHHLRKSKENHSLSQKQQTTTTRRPETMKDNHSKKKGKFSKDP